MENSLKKFIEGMPKTELHLHIEGTLEPELMFELAKRNHVTLPYASVEELKKAYDFHDLQEFLDLYYQGMKVLQTERDFYELTYAYLEKAASQHVTHTEIFFDPQGHTERGVAFATAIKGINQALKDGEKKLGVSSKLIMSFLRHLPEKASAPPEERKYKDAFETLDEARPYIEKGIIQGIGLDSSEKGYPPSNFARVFAEAKRRHPQLMLGAHAGEEGPAEYVRQAVHLLKVDRIDHGNRALEDFDLVTQLVHRKIGLTVCPLSNLRLRNVWEMIKHPLKVMLNHGLKASVNSDDPAYFGGYITENFLAVAEALKLTRDDVIQLARNAIDTSFLSPAEKAQKTQELNTYITRFTAGEKFVNGGKGTARSPA